MTGLGEAGQNQAHVMAKGVSRKRLLCGVRGYTSLQAQLEEISRAMFSSEQDVPPDSLELTLVVSGFIWKLPGGW